MHACRLQAGFRRPILRNHRRRLRSLDRVQLGLLGCWPWLGVRQQERVRGRLNLPAADLCGLERGQLLRVNRKRLRRDAGVQCDLSQGRVGLRKRFVQGWAHLGLRGSHLHHRER